MDIVPFRDNVIIYFILYGVKAPVTLQMKGGFNRHPIELHDTLDASF